MEDAWRTVVEVLARYGVLLHWRDRTKPLSSVSIAGMEQG